MGRLRDGFFPPGNTGRGPVLFGLGALFVVTAIVSACQALNLTNDAGLATLALPSPVASGFVTATERAEPTPTSNEGRTSEKSKTAASPNSTV